MRIISIFLLLTLSIGANAQIDKFKAIFIYKFIQSFEWPSSKVSGSYTIGVFGNDGLYSELSSLSDGRLVNGKSIEVVKYTSGDTSSDLCMLIVSENNKNMLGVLKTEAEKNSFVLVGESPGSAIEGASINFVSNGSNLKFELNEESLNKCNVRAPSSIKSLAILVN